MGLDLTLIPVDADNGTLFFGHTRLRLERDYELFDEIKKLKAIELDKPFSCHEARNGEGEASYGPVTEDAYGDPLTKVRPEKIAALVSHVAADPHKKNRAALAYLKELDLSAWVVLFWD
jgi:hypothetical protein